MSLISQAMVFEKYGERLNAEQLAAFFGVTVNTFYNLVSGGRCPIPTYLDGKGRYADFRDVAAHLDACRERATT